MTKIKVADMHCEHCVNRITTALNAAGLTFTISLDEKSVTVDASSQKAATEILYDLGFTPK